MDYLNPAWAICATGLALASCALLERRFPSTDTAGRYDTIDGLRGYLALSVFLYHSSIWYGLLKTGKWTGPPSHFYTYLGHTSVALFFMITAFLFFGKLLHERRPIDWGALFVGRLIRLYPLYLSVVIAVFIITAFRTRQLNDTPLDLLVEAGKWLTFTLMGDVPINKVADSWLVDAGVTWSLAYEWLFYASLPALALFVGRCPSPIYLSLSIAAIAAAIAGTTHWRYVLSFAGGIVAAILSQHGVLTSFAVRRAASVVVVSSIAIEVAVFPTAYSVGALALLTVAFTLVANGCSVFGILTARTSRALGNLSYSIYLLHGLVLFLAISALRTTAWSNQLSATTFWITILTLVPFLIGLSFASYRFIELPPMARAGDVVRFLKERRGAPSGRGGRPGSPARSC